jgi:hypothetical protein
MDANQNGGNAAPAPDKADELLSKADALLGRYRPSAIASATQEPFAITDDKAMALTPPSEPVDFPVLTEIVDLPDAGPANAAEAATHFPPLLEAEPFDQSAVGIALEAGAETAAIDEARLREQILATLAPDLEQRLSDTLKPRANELLDWAMQTVQLELGLSIRAAVRSAVAIAVDEALEKHRRSARPE